MNITTLSAAGTTAFVTAALGVTATVAELYAIPVVGSVFNNPLTHSLLFGGIGGVTVGLITKGVTSVHGYTKEKFGSLPNMAKFYVANLSL